MFRRVGRLQVKRKVTSGDRVVEPEVSPSITSTAPRRFRCAAKSTDVREAFDKFSETTVAGASDQGLVELPPVRTFSKRPSLKSRPYSVYERAARPEDILIAVLVPVLDRPARARPLVDSLRESREAARLYFIVNPDDEAELAACREEATRDPTFVRVLIVPAGRRSWAKKINDGVRRTMEPWVLLGADDLRFHNGWVTEALKIARSNPNAGVIGTRDLGHQGTIEGWHSTHPIVSRKYAKELGSIDDRRRLVHEGYRHNFADTEIVATAKLRHAYVHADRSIVEHLHPFWGKAKDDATYLLGRKHLQGDRRLFLKRTIEFGWETRG